MKDVGFEQFQQFCEMYFLFWAGSTEASPKLDSCKDSVCWEDIFFCRREITTVLDFRGEYQITSPFTGRLH